MENPEETLQVLEEWATRRARPCGGGGAATAGALPRQLDEYLAHVARTGDPVFHWASVKPLIKEKLLSAVSEFHETAPGLDVPLAPNVDPFNYEAMRALLLERLDSFTSAPFTVQRLCELLTAPRKQYNRIDKFMRAVEKNVLVVSTREPGTVRGDHDEPIERALNGSDGNSDCGVDVDMEDVSWRDARHPPADPPADPLAGASHRTEPERVPDTSAALPIVTAAVVGRSSPPADDKMDDAPEVPEPIPKPAETVKQVEQKEESSTTDSKSESNDSMDIEVTKEIAPEPIEPVETTPKEVESASTSVVHTSSEEDSNSNPEPAAAVPDPEPEHEPEGESELKAESVTSGEDSSSSNSSENTDGESERGGADSASRSPERSGASEGESSSEPPEQDGDSEPKAEPVASEPEKVEPKPVPVRPEGYTVADIHIESAAAPPPAAESPAVAEPEPATIATEKPATTETSSEERGKPSAEEPVKPPAEEPMQTETSEETAQPLPS